MSGRSLRRAKVALRPCLVGDDDLLRMVAEQVEQKGRLGGRHDLHRLPRLAGIRGITQPVKRIAHLAQQPRMDAPVGLLEAHHRRRLRGE